MMTWPQLLDHLPVFRILRNWNRRKLAIERIEQQLLEIRRFYQPRFDAAKTEDEDQDVTADYLNDSRELDSQLNAIHWSQLVRKAMKYGVELPPGTYPMGHDPYRSLSRRVNEARFLFYERWARIIVPILSLVVALVALLSRWGK